MRMERFISTSVFDRFTNDVDLHSIYGYGYEYIDTNMSQCYKYDADKGYTYMVHARKCDVTWFDGDDTMDIAEFMRWSKPIVEQDTKQWHFETYEQAHSVLAQTLADFRENERYYHALLAQISVWDENDELTGICCLEYAMSDNTTVIPDEDLDADHYATFNGRVVYVEV